MDSLPSCYSILGQRQALLYVTLERKQTFSKLKSQGVENWMGLPGWHTLTACWALVNAVVSGDNVLHAHVSVLTLTMTNWKLCNCTHKAWPCTTEFVHHVQIHAERVNYCPLLNYTVYKAESFLLNTFGMVHFPSLTLKIKSSRPSEAFSYILLAVDLHWLE